ncbi:restriction endonuclease subunit S [Bacillaceae bacterium S4-13-58]
MVDGRKIPEGYKLTEVGVIPEDWDEIYLSKALLGSPKYGINAAAVDYSESLPTYLRITDISDDGRFIRSKKVSVDNESSENYYLEENDLVFARTGASTGKTYLYDSNDGKLVYAGFLIKVSVDQKIMDPRFLKSYTQTETYWNWVRVMSMRSGQPGINGNEYFKLKLPLPPLSEQNIIANALFDTDNLIQSIEKLIEKKKKIKQGAIQQLLTGKKRLPEFDGEWEVKKLGEIATVSMGQSPSSKYYNSNMKGLPLIQGNADIDKRRSIIRIYTTQITKRCSKGDIIMTVRAPVGAIAKASTDSCLGRGVCSINFKNDYLYYFLLSIEEKWSQMSKGSTFDSISASDVLTLEVSLPALKDEQNAIAQVLSDMDLEIEALEEKLEKVKTIKQGMMQELLTGRIRLI